MPLPALRRCWTVLLTLCLIPFCPTRSACAQASRAAEPPGEVNQAYLREHYTKYEYKIPARDGVRLFTAVYVPKDQAERYPILLTRTPYGVGPYGVDFYPEPHGPLRHYAKDRFIFAMQDVRGTHGSEGKFVDMRPHRPADAGPKDIDESTDAYDTIDWLVRNVPNNSGKVGIIGVSYPGFYAASAMIDSHPALKCASPQAPMADLFVGDDTYHNGAFRLAAEFGFESGFGQKLEDPIRDRPKPFDYKTPDGYQFYLSMGPLANADKRFFKGRIEPWNDVLAHGTYDAFWQSRDLRRQIKNVGCAVMTVGGWFDAEDLFGTLATYRAVEGAGADHDPARVNMLVMGPWPHGGWSDGDGQGLGPVSFGAKTAEFYRENIERPFLNHFLKDDLKFDLPKAYVFETGTNQWRRYDAWPPKASTERSLYLRSGQRLSFEPPQSGEADFDEYVSDPAKPVPHTFRVATGMTREYMIDDQRFAASRPDVLVFQTDVLDEDFTIAGPVEADLTVSTSGTDSDWVVKLIDVYPGDYPGPDPNPGGVVMGGYQQLVRADVMRGKFRDNLEHPRPFEPGRQTRVAFVLPDVYHAFRRGHHIMVQVQSSWFPLIDRNPQTFCDISRARPEDFRKSTQRVYHAADALSQILVRSLK